jgi:transcription antitermination factor NusA-like protein
MATTADDATASGSAAPAKTPAQLMQEQHEAAEAHKPTIEDVVDEDDIEHPPPSHSAPKEDDKVPAPTNGSMSAKAAGKQKATEKLGVLDTQDEEAFPALGPASKPSSGPAPRLGGWAASASKASKQNGSTPTSRPASSGVSTPVSTPGMMTPTSSAAGARQGVMLPGRHVDSFDISNADVNRSKPIRKVLDDVKKKFGVLVTTKTINSGTGMSFVAEGPKARVTDALMYISQELTNEKSVKLEVPSSVSARIIGQGGNNIKKLEGQFHCKIRIDRDKNATVGPEDVRTDTVEIKGHAAQVRQAEAYVANLAREFQPKIDIPLRNIPPEFYPFLAGRYGPRLQQMQGDDLEIKIPEYHTWQHQAPPRAAEPSQGPRFVPHGNSHIVLSGDQARARQVRQELERLAEQLEQELALEELACEQILHPYIVGKRGMDPVEFMKQTGCAIVVPPSHQDLEDIHIIGPKDRLEEGRNLAEELMSKKHNRAVDLNKHFQDAPYGPQRHSRALAQYLQKKAIQREFQNSHSAEIVFPNNVSASPSWNIITSDAQKALSARNELSKITQAYPTPRLQLLEVDPFFHPHLHELHADHLQTNLGVHMIVPDNGEDPVVLVYEGPATESPFSIPRSRPTQADLAEFEKALLEAQALLMGSIPQQGISTDDFTVPRKMHDKVRKFVNSEPKPRPPEAFPVQIDFGSQRARRAEPAQKSSPDRVFLRGPSEADIAELRKKIEQFLIEAEQDEKERGFTLTFDFPQKYNKLLIGRQGAHINQLRDKHDVQIDTKDVGKVKIQGPQKKAEACKAEILKLLKAWEDEVDYTIKVDPKYHGMLVGRNGENLQKIQNKVNNDVRIDFPRVSRFSDDASVADTASEAGGRPAGAADEIRIRGPKAKAEKVKDELLSLKQYLEDNSYTATVSVAQGQIASLIGRRGAEMERLRAETGAQIDIPKGDGGSERVVIQIKGTKQQVDKAKAELQKRSKVFDNVMTQILEVDKKHHRSLIGSGGKL